MEICLPSLGGHREYLPTIALINTLQAELVTWIYVVDIVFEEYKRLKKGSTRPIRKIAGENWYLASFVRRNPVKTPLKYETSDGIICYNCTKLGQYMKYC